MEKVIKKFPVENFGMFLVISIFQNDYIKLKRREIYKPKTKLLKVVDFQNQISVKGP